VESAVYLTWAIPFTGALLTAAFAPGQWSSLTCRAAAMSRRVMTVGVRVEAMPRDLTAPARPDDPVEVLLARRQGTVRIGHERL
jgi:hypothetical protein